MRVIAPGSTNQSTRIRVLDAAGAAVTTIVAASSGLALWYHRAGGLKVAITPTDLAAVDSAHSDGGIKHIGDGWYRLDMPDAACAVGAADVLFGGAVTGGYIDGLLHPLSNVAVDAHLARAAIANKSTHAVATGVDVIYDDDGVTVLKTITPSETGGVVTLTPS